MKFIKKVLRGGRMLINPVTILNRSSASFFKQKDKNGGIVPFFTGKHSVVELSRDYLYFENEAIQYWKVFFDLFYYLLVVPFRFVWDPLSGTYICYTNKIQKVLHYSVFLTMTCCFLFRLRKISTSNVNLEKNPTEYFEMAVYFFDSTFMILLFLHFGKQKHLVHQVFLDLQNHNNGFYRNATNHKKTRFHTTLILTICMGTVIIKFCEMLQEENFNFMGFLRMRQKESEELFVCKSLTETLPWFFVFFNVFSTLYEKVLNDAGDILFTMCALLVNNLVSTFKLDMETSDIFAQENMLQRRENKTRTDNDLDSHSPQRILNHYTWLKQITQKINSAMSLITGAFIAGNLPFFATHILDVFGGQDWNVFVRLRYIFACSYFFPSMFIAAIANKKVEHVKEWICKEENYTKIPPIKLNAFLHELSFNSVGLSSFGVLTITWNSVGSIISIVITYALLKTQFKMDPSTTPVIGYQNVNFTAGIFENHGTT